jgi:galactoside O-acetyltransferase
VWNLIFYEDNVSIIPKGCDVMTNKEKLHSGDIYYPSGDDIMIEQLGYLDKLYDFNMTRPSELDKRAKMLKEMFAEIGEDCYIEPPFHSNWGGHHVHFGKSVYANFGLTMVDDTHIYVGDYTMFGPNVVVATAGHPILPELREKAYQYNMPVHIGRNCWIGAGALILPGVTIGDNTVIGAGSVVTKDIPSNVVAVGNPCKVLREIGEHDKEYYFRNRKINYEDL